MTELFHHKDISLEYKTLGKGENYLLAFPGFGRPPDDFDVFEPVIGVRYTIYAFPHFHYGKSHYPLNRIEKNTIKKEELKLIFEKFLEEKEIHQFSLIGYSMGGKIALTLTELFPEKIQSLLLFAPDGLQFNFWYWLITCTGPGKFFYKNFIENPQWFFKSIAFLKACGLIHEKLYRFLMMHINSPESRELVYKVWMTYRYLQPDIETVKKHVNEKNIDVKLFFGKYDKIISPAQGKKFTNGLRQKEVVYILESGHRLLTPENAKKFAEVTGAH